MRYMDCVNVMFELEDVLSFAMKTCAVISWFAGVVLAFIGFYLSAVFLWIMAAILLISSVYLE